MTISREPLQLYAILTVERRFSKRTLQQIMSPPKSEEHQYDENINRAAAKADEIGSKFARQRALKSVMDNGMLMVNLVKDYAMGAYREVPYWVMGVTAMALVYVLSPLDVIPDVLPGIGFLDDAAVVAFALRLIEKELERYKHWKDGGKKPPVPAVKGKVIDV
ncbi:MAG: hypothetical protein JWO08_4640 [Verrucomicrobiaceae bacterium]|nr:hypothetical protein [Verrucomicrobiaceae bacterium]